LLHARTRSRRANAYARDRVVFGRPIGQNQGVQFPIAEAHIEIEAADLMRWPARPNSTEPHDIARYKTYIPFKYYK